MNEEEREKQRKYSREYYYKNKETVLKRSQDRYRKNAVAISKKWRDEHPLDELPEYNKTPDSVLEQQALIKIIKNAPKFRAYIRKLMKEIEINKE